MKRECLSTHPQASPVQLAPTEDDREREIRIAALKDVMDKAGTVSRRRLAWSEMQAEIRARSPQMVAAMEAAQRIA